MKVCTKCKSKKDISDFGIDNTKKDGLTSWCKECWRNYRKCNKKVISIRNKTYRDENPEKISNILRAWKKKNPDYNTEYYRKNRKACIKKTRIWRKNNKHKVFNQNVKRRANEKVCMLGKEDWLKVMHMNDWKCFYCNVRLSKENRTIDHVFSIHSGGINKIINCVPACISCNCSKKDTLVCDWTKFKYLPTEKQQYLIHVLYKLGVVIER